MNKEIVAETDINAMRIEYLWDLFHGKGEPYYEGTAADIAEDLDWSPGLVHQVVHRFRHRSGPSEYDMTIAPVGHTRQWRFMMLDGSEGLGRSGLMEVDRAMVSQLRGIDTQHRHMVVFGQAIADDPGFSASTAKRWRRKVTQLQAASDLRRVPHRGHDGRNRRAQRRVI